MQKVRIFPKGCTDASGVGLYGIQTTAATVSAAAAGQWEIQVDVSCAAGEWRAIENGGIVKAIVPMASTPMPDNPTYKAVAAGTTVYATLPQSYTAHMHNGTQRTITTPGIIISYAPTPTTCVVLDTVGSYTRVRFSGGAEAYVLTADLTASDGAGFDATDRTEGPQLFRIYSARKSLSGMSLVVSARHWSYSLENIYIGSVDEHNMTVQTAIDKIRTESLDTPACLIKTNITGGSIRGDWEKKNVKACLLDPDDGVVPQARARLIRDNADYIILRNTQEDAVVQLKYGRNLKGVTWTKKTDGIKYRVVPVANDTDGNALYLPEIYVDSTRIGECTDPQVPSERLDVDVQVDKTISWATGSEETLTTARCYELMREAAAARFTVNKIDEPQLTLDVDFVLMGDTEEYAQYKNLEHIRMYDYVKVDCSPLDINPSMQMISYKWDALRGEYTKISLGDPWDYSALRVVAGYELVNGAVTSRASGGGGGRAGKKKDTELDKLQTRYTLKVEQDNEHFAILATEEEWSEMKNNYLLTHESHFSVTAREIASKVAQTDFDELDNTVGQYHTEIQQNANTISLIATAEDLKNASSSKSLFQVHADGINSKVAKNGVISAINQTAESITISANKINLQGVVEATQFSTKVAEIVSGWSEDFACLSFSSNSVTTGSVDADSINGVTGPQGISISVDGVYKATVLGSGSDVNFDRAAAQREGANSVYISPSDIKKTDSDYALNGGAPYYDVTVEATAISNKFADWSSETTEQVIRVPATDAYNDGVTEGESHFEAVTVNLRGTKTVIYKRGTKTTVNLLGTKTVIYKRGTKTEGTNLGTKRENACYGYTNYASGASRELFRKSGDSYVSVGTHIWRYGGTVKNLYEAGSDYTLYGNGGSVEYYTDGGTADYYTDGGTVEYYADGGTATYYRKKTT